MKRLWAFVSIAILLIGILGVFNVPQAGAQSAPPAGDSVSNDQLIQHVGNGLFREIQLALTNEKTAIVGRKNTPQYQTELQTNTAEMAAFVQARTAFEDYLISHSNLPAAQRYSEALQAASVAAVQFQQSSPLLQQGTGKDFITNLTNQLNLEAQKTDWIRAITTGQAISTDSQLAANATTQSANPSRTDQPVTSPDCTLNPVNFSLTNCLSAGFTWLIKNTLLQLAGFLVWLTANLLNYSIQVSILNFKDWAPDSLYPLWIIVRQIVSLLVVFAGLYLGFMYIIGRTEAFGKYVGWLILFALFVNFSYPFSRTLVDISNIVSLNVYSAAVGGSALSTDFSSAATTIGGDTAGAIIMNKLGLYGLAASATSVETSGGGFVKDINSTPAALLAVVFVFYAAYIFFMATAIIVTRTIVLVFLTVASPLLLVDSVIPKLGDAAMKMRKMFFEQLVAAPVFMLMLALTLKFMDVFQVAGKVSGAVGGTDSVKMFFSILMMLIMLHIMLKVTKSVAGQAGDYATNFMGKVGGFGLAAATGGAGVLARGTIGAGAARLRDSAWMDKLQGSAAGRGLYGLSNSLAQSTFDARSVGMISGGMAKAGLTGGFGMSMQRATVKNIDDARIARATQIEKKGMSIKDDNARTAYFNNANKGRLVRVDDEKLKETAKSIEDKKRAQLEAMMNATDPRKRETLVNEAVMAKDYAMADKLRAGDSYHGVDNNSPDAVQKKADLLKKMGVDNAAVAKDFLKKDPFKDLASAHDDLVKQLQEDAAKINRKTPEGEAAYRDIQAKLGEENASFRQKTDQLRKDTLAAFAGVSTGSPISAPTQVDFNTETGEIRDFAAYAAARRKEKQAAAMRGGNPSAGSTGATSGPTPNTPTPNQPAANDADAPLPEIDQDFPVTEPVAA